MKNTIFFFMTIFVYVNADFYNITTSSITSVKEDLISISDSLETTDENVTCTDGYVNVHQNITNMAMYDGFGTYMNTKINKGIEFCNSDPTEISGTMTYILLLALGFENEREEIACPISKGVYCFQEKFNIVAGNFSEVFLNDENSVTLQLNIPAMLTAEFNILKTDGLPVFESVTDSSAEEESELQREIDDSPDDDPEERGGGVADDPPQDEVPEDEEPEPEEEPAPEEPAPEETAPEELDDED